MLQKNKELPIPENLNTSRERVIELIGQLQMLHNVMAQDDYDMAYQKAKPLLKEFSDIYYVRVSAIHKKAGKAPVRYKLWKFNEVNRFRAPLA